MAIPAVVWQCVYRIFVPQRPRLLSLTFLVVVVYCAPLALNFCTLDRRIISRYISFSKKLFNLSGHSLIISVIEFRHLSRETGRCSLLELLVTWHQARICDWLTTTQSSVTNDWLTSDLVSKSLDNSDVHVCTCTRIALPAHFQALCRSCSRLV